MKLHLTFLILLAFLAVPVIADIPEVLPDPDTTPPDTTKPVKVFILSGQSNMVGFGRVAGSEAGTLETITGAGMFPWLVDDQGAWNVRNDVMYRGVISATGDVPLQPGYGANNNGQISNNFGPELGFGHVMGYYCDEPVIVLKSSIGNRGLNWDCLPPGSPRYIDGATTYAAYGESPYTWTTGDGPSPFVWYAGKQYDDFFLDEADMNPMPWANGADYSVNVKNMQYQVKHNGQIYISKVLHIASPDSEPGVGASWTSFWQPYSVPGGNVVDVLDNFATEYPEYADQGFEIAGFGWWQGHWDGGEQGTGTASVAALRYETNLTNLINSLREYYETRYPDNTKPNAPFVVATVGFGGGDWEAGSSADVIHTAQMAVGDGDKHPEFAGNVASVDTTGYWRDGSISPTTTGYHYNHNAETYMLVGDAMGRAMAELATPYSVNAGPDMVTWSGQTIALDATVQEDITVTSYLWTAIPNDGVVFSDPAIEDPTVTITKPAGDMDRIVLILTVNDGINEPVTDSIRVEVYDTACQATRLGLGITNSLDLTEDCIIDVADLAVMANKWLDDKSLIAPVPKTE